MLRLTPVTKYLLIANVAVFLLFAVIPGGNMFGLHFFLAPDFHFYQLFTYMFMHANFQHIFFNMFALWMFGCVMESVWGGRKFLFYYISCGIGAGICQELAQLGQFYLIAQEQIPGFNLGMMNLVAQNSAEVLNQWTTVGASGAIYAILLAFGMTFPNDRIFIFPIPVPIKAKWFVLFYVFIELFSAISTSSDGVAHFAHLGGMLIGFLMIRHWNHHPEGLNMDGGSQFFSNLKNQWDRHQHKSSNRWSNTREDSSSRNTSHETDWEYNERKKKEEQEMDEILDKIRKSGYDSLTPEEKRRLFDFNNK
ncbi:MAG: rhomboid family intramembrane serine protease [Prevotella sp.]|jgi:membrane associated rhomboid family serine protease